MRFAEIPGLEETKNLLIQAIKKDKVAHAQLFYGISGSANLALALAYAAFVNCENRAPSDSCGECRSCRKIDKLIHPDLQFVLPVCSTKSITGKNVVSANFLKDWRSFMESGPYPRLEEWLTHFGAENKQANISKEESRNIIRALSLKSFEAEYKILLIWLPEYMHAAAANGILKILEEPPQKTLFLLVTCDYEKLLTTILSRCQLFKVPAFSEKEISQYLVSKKGVLQDKASHISTLAEGSINKAELLLNNVEDDTHLIFRDWMRHCWKKNFTALHETNEVFARLGKNAQKLLLQYGLNMMRQALVGDYLIEEKMKLNAEEQDFVFKFGKAMSDSKLENISAELNKAHYHLERNANAKILFLDLSLTIGKIMAV